MVTYVSRILTMQRTRAFDLLEMGMTETAMSSPVNSQQRSDGNSGFGLSLSVWPPLAVVYLLPFLSLLSLYQPRLGFLRPLNVKCGGYFHMNVKAEKVLLPNLEIQTRSFNLVGAQVSPMNEL